MYRIRFHGRGGQGIKTAGRILGSALFIEGYEVQDAPRYGAERRGAPIFSYVRASRFRINERGVIRKPDLIVVADETLIGMPSAGVLEGAGERTVLVIIGEEREEVWRHRLNFKGKIIMLSLSGMSGNPVIHHHAGVVCSGIAAQLLGVVGAKTLEKAVREELLSFGEDIIKKNQDSVLSVFEKLKPFSGLVQEGDVVGADDYEKPKWVDIPFENSYFSTPAIYNPATSEKSQTGLWRTVRPVLRKEMCHSCWWICSAYCPDSAIRTDEGGFPEFDYEHCKGCLICIAQCPNHALEAIPEKIAGKGGR